MDDHRLVTVAHDAVLAGGRIHIVHTRRRAGVTVRRDTATPVEDFAAPAGKRLQLLAPLAEVVLATLGVPVLVVPVRPSGTGRIRLVTHALHGPGDAFTLGVNLPLLAQVRDLVPVRAEMVRAAAGARILVIPVRFAQAGVNVLYRALVRTGALGDTVFPIEQVAVRAAKARPRPVVTVEVRPARAHRHVVIHGGKVLIVAGRSLYAVGRVRDAMAGGVQRRLDAGTLRRVVVEPVRAGVLLDRPLPLATHVVSAAFAWIHMVAVVSLVADITGRIEPGTVVQKGGYTLLPVEHRHRGTVVPADQPTGLAFHVRSTVVRSGGKMEPVRKIATTILIGQLLRLRASASYRMVAAVVSGLSQTATESSGAHALVAESNSIPSGQGPSMVVILPPRHRYARRQPWDVSAYSPFVLPMQTAS
uniref:Uncharacterized protein n=1 Tax=Anopheles merus TaxID=30066 RepID=A0A182VP14_ANOME